jgi:hypothetical protein
VNCLSGLNVAIEVLLFFQKIVFMTLLLTMVAIDGCCIYCNAFPIGTPVVMVEIPKNWFITTPLHQPLIR